MTLSEIYNNPIMQVDKAILKLVLEDWKQELYLRSWGWHASCLKWFLEESTKKNTYYIDKLYTVSDQMSAQD